MPFAAIPSKQVSANAAAMVHSSPAAIQVEPENRFSTAIVNGHLWADTGGYEHLRADIGGHERIDTAGKLFAVQILDEVRRQGRVTIGQMVRVTPASLSTLRDHLRTLVDKQQLVRYGNGKGSWYALP